VVRFFGAMLLSLDQGPLKQKRRFRTTKRRAKESKLRDVIVFAARKTGDNGRGRNGLVGYLRRLAISHPIRFSGLVYRMIELDNKYFPSDED
jgi:hypothetical protein